MKRKAAKALKEKYNEKFVIHKAWLKNQTTFYITGSPKNDIDVVFEAEIYKDGRGVYKDGYVKAINYGKADKCKITV